jgi:sporulation protein YlmC with PRC-barrel domain
VRRANRSAKGTNRFSSRFHPVEIDQWSERQMLSLAPRRGATMMWNKLAMAATLAAAVAGTAYGQQSTTTGAATQVQAKVLGSLPANSVTVTNYYRQNVYDPSDAKIGEISDVLVSKEGKVEAFIVSVGGFLGIGQKDVAVPFSAVRATEKNGTWYLTMNATKDSLKQARGYTHDKAKATWVPAA